MLDAEGHGGAANMFRPALFPCPAALRIYRRRNGVKKPLTQREGATNAM